MEIAEELIDISENDNCLSREEIIKEYLPYVKRIVHRIAIHLPPSVEIDDLINAGIIGLIEAVERYDPARDNKFMTYAVFRIRGSVLSELRARDYHSRSTRRKVREYENTYLRLEQQAGKSVNDEDIAHELNISLDECYHIKRMSSMSFLSFEELGFSSKEERDNIVNYFLSGEGSDAYRLTRVKEIEQAVADAIEELPKNEKLVISLYYWDELTMKEIGSVLEITESRVSQIHSQAIIHLRARLKKEKLIGE
ncbi:RNA polymerase sigma factor FliA [uncultured Desulfobacterium sp.]|uniref:RNA polymerase sigma factor FliA n=1 Tax=uncultured Desulfobacterium sp. TaxID=201089 RepID=A0A445MT85_9BACT|nr:RNA polymerase sigma factor FliA [uncultured Desulfobacterium sp.]